MKLLVSAANGRTGRHVIRALRARRDCPTIVGLARSAVEHADESMLGDMDDPTLLARAVRGVDAVVHYGPSLQSRETAMGTAMIDAAKAAGVRRFVFISVIHPEIDDLLNHKAKLAIEAYLINSGLDWTVLRPQHYMQTVDVARAVKEGRLTAPYPLETVLAHVDMVDLPEAAAKVVMEPGHAYATYDISADEPLSVRDICAKITEWSGARVEPVVMDPYAMVEIMRSHSPRPLTNYTVESIHRLFGYYARRGIQGNANVATWLLGRAPGSYDAYVQRSLASSIT